jgi:hypothetical protein
MAEQRMTVRDRLAGLDRLEMSAAFLNKLAAWLAEADAQVEADMVQSAAHSCLAAAWWLSRPVRSPPPPERWPGMEQPVPYQQAPDQRRQA